MEASVVMVRIDDPEHMNLLGLLLQGFLTRQLDAPALRARASRLRGDFGLQAGEMAVTLSFDGAGILIKKGFTAVARARILGPMHEMVAVAGGGAWRGVASVLSGRVTIRGNVLALVGLMPIMLAKPPAAPAPAERSA